MKKRLICIAIIVSFTLGGCQSKSDDYLSYKDTFQSSGYSDSGQLMGENFYAKDLAIVKKSDNSGGDAKLTAGASLLVNRTDHKVLYANHVYRKLYPASITKLMTALVVLQNSKMSDEVTISYNASHITEIGAKLCGFEEGDTISLEALFKSMLVYSGNDAAVALAEHVGGSVDTFVKMMNKEAKRIGAVHTKFVNPNGLHDDNQYTTAYDLYLIFNELLENDNFRSIINLASYDAQYSDKNGNPKEKKFSTTDLYLNGHKTVSDKIKVLGGKTGTTSKAGNCLILLSKDKKNNEYISVILKAFGREDLYTQMTHLMLKEMKK
jgi:D-alanyl-D-alanine carboxypeptidase